MPSASQNPDPSRRRDASQQPDSNELSPPQQPLGPAYDPLAHRPGSAHYYSSILSILDHINTNKPLIMPARCRELMQQLDLVEWSGPYPDGVEPRQVPFFVSDVRFHEQLGNLYERVAELAKAGARQETRTLRRGRGRTKLSPDQEKSLDLFAELQEKIDGIHGQLHKRHYNWNASAGDAFVRLMPFARSLRDQTARMPQEIREFVVKVVLRPEEISPSAKIQRRRILEHAVKLARLPNPDLHLRKFNIGILQQTIDLQGDSLEQRFARIKAEVLTDDYLQDHRSRAGKSALAWLNSSRGGNYCPPPYPSWQGDLLEECRAASQKIVVGARQLSYAAFSKLRLENRHLAGAEPLFHTFVKETHEQVKLAHGSDIDLPPGRGIFMAGPLLNKLFHGYGWERGAEGDPRYRDTSGAWWGPAMASYENTSAIFLRGWIAVLNPAPEFKLFNTRYALVIDNNHFTDLYGCAYGIPESVITQKVASTLHSPDRKPGKRTADLSAQEASVSGLIDATIEAGLPPLVLGTMSQLFGGMSNALPVGHSPTLTWELSRQGGAWKDVYNHVHWSWMVWGERSTESVTEKAAPMAEADREIRKFAIAGQQILGLFFDRYAAWKGDLTPGARAAPIMLRKAYEIYRATRAEHPSIPKDEKVYIGLYNRNSPGTLPTPLIDCSTMQLLRHGEPVQLPTWSDGTENRELNVWREMVRPILTKTAPDGLEREGDYELAIIGTKDIKGIA